MGSPPGSHAKSCAMADSGADMARATAASYCSREMLKLPRPNT
jgi:hypothetical protein